MDFGNLDSRILFFILSYVTSEKVKWLGNDDEKKTKQHAVIS